MKRVAAAALMAACLVSLSACSAEQDDTAAAPKISLDGAPVNDATAQSLKAYAIQSLGANNEQLILQIAMAESMGDVDSAEIFSAQKDIKKELGEIKAVDIENAYVVQLADGSYTAVLPVTFTKGSMQYVLNMDMVTQKMQGEFIGSTSGEEDKSMDALLDTATVYSAIGIGTVFAVLVFISLLIACFKLIHKWETGKKAEGNTPAPVSVPTAPVPVVSQDLSGDAELAAVITAAIAAYEGTSQNGLVVRSIRRIKNSRGR